MKTIIAGCRTANDYEVLKDGIRQVVDWDITEVVCGCAQGADELGRMWAIEHGVPVKEFPANWERYGKMAGVRRNEGMGKYAEALVALWDGKSPGTGHMIQYALDAGLTVRIWRID